MKIELLNHASVIFKSDGVALLCDPWFSGTAFAGGWGLQYNNPDALEKAASCTHLWISHFHPDHLHMATLRQLAELSPDLIVLANDSMNFKIAEPLQRVGFKNILPFYERKELPLAVNIKVTRFPTAGIDNMLYIETPEGKILNYNDCHLPIDALKSLMRKIGGVDILLNNFNHAIKFIENPRRSDEQIRNQLKRDYKKVVDAISPRWVIPFASAHYYRTRDTFWQNDSLLQSEELLDLDSRILPLRIGSELTFEDKLNNPRFSPESSTITLNPKDIKQESESVEFDNVVQAAKGFGRRLRQSLLGLTFWIPPLRIRVEESQRVIVFDVHNQAYVEDREMSLAHIQAHSSALSSWFTKPFGADSFFIGGHFAVVTDAIKPIKRVLLACSLMEKRLAPRSLASYVTSPRGIKFVFNRREEIVITLKQRRLRVGNRVS